MTAALRARPLVVSFFDLSGEWSAPFLAAADVVRLDLQHPHGTSRAADGAILIGGDIRKAATRVALAAAFAGRRPDVLLAAPPCDCFTRASAHLWPTSDASGRTAAALWLVDFIIGCVRGVRPRVFAIENPPGRLWNKKGTGLRQAALGELRHEFDPWQYGALAPDDPQSRNTKHTYLWGRFVPPEPAPHPAGRETYPAHLPPRKRDSTTRVSSSAKNARSRTPRGFALAFAAANPVTPRG